MKELTRHHAKPDLMHLYHNSNERIRPALDTFKTEQPSGVNSQKDISIPLKPNNTNFWRTKAPISDDKHDVSEFISCYKLQKGFSELLNTFQFKP